MSSFLRYALAATLVMISAVRADDEKIVLDILKPSSAAALKGDFSASIKIIYKPAIKDMGGKEALLAAVDDLEKQMAADGFRMVKNELLKPVRFVKGEKNRYAIVRTLTEMDTPKGPIRTHSFQLGIEVEPGKWQFIDGTRADFALKKYFKDFPADEKLPDVKHEPVPGAL